MPEVQSDHFVNLIFKLLSDVEPIETIFTSMVDYFEELNPEIICSILILDNEKKHFDKIIAPRLPDFYNKSIYKLEVGEKAGSCGTAAFFGRRVIVEDINTDALWDNYRDLAKAARLASCWSEPIKTKAGMVLGTFAIYYRDKHKPSDRDVHTIEQGANLASIILQHFEARRMVKKSQERISIMYESSIDAMWLVDIENQGKTFRFKSVNDAFVTITGLKREDVIDKTIEEVLPPSSIPLVREKYTEAMQSGNIVDYLEIAPLPAGLRYGQIRVKPIKNESGVVTKILGIAEDTTEQTRIYQLLKQNEADLIYAQQVAQMGSWKWNIKEDVVHWSKELYNILNLDPNKPALPYEEQSKLYTPETWDKLSKAVQNAIVTGSSYEVDLQGITKDGEPPHWYIARGEVVEKDQQGNPLRMAGTLQDNTDRKLLENNLKSALSARDEFIAIATHELKTPLSTLQLALYSLNKDIHGDFDKEKLKIRAEKAKMQGDRLDSLINKLLDVTSMGAGKMRLQLKPAVNISNSVENIIKKFEENFLKSGTALTKNIEPGIIGASDEFRFEQVITNLISNAIKYGDSNPITINLRRSGKNILFEIHDNGIGISEDKVKKVFDRFERAVSETSYNGLGLGLWIVKEIVTAMNGKVWVTSMLNKGSCFSVELPLKEQI